MIKSSAMLTVSDVPVWIATKLAPLRPGWRAMRRRVRELVAQRRGSTTGVEGIMDPDFTRPTRPSRTELEECLKAGQ